ncbi:MULTISPECIES: hypothetical protein [Streptomyces]|uniref:Uncharacterized protein n=1 Tax=Streptomyces andamanensis TaxID=1565035 RepID=A0ABV8TMG5_9ACTN|nr:MULTISPECIES: hypothetical protein [unclassified Streptomyces]EYT81038.1 membrane protein [Streptomyces sp. Tu 6176]
MEHHPLAVRLVEAANTTSQHQGSGYLLKVVLVVMVLGCALTGWFLLRGYKRNDD